MDFVVAVKTNSESAKVVEPAECSSETHRKMPRPPSMFLIPFCQVRFDASFAKFFSVNRRSGSPLSATHKHVHAWVS